MPRQATQGTDADVRARVRQFYGHWGRKLFGLEGNVALANDEVDVEFHNLPAQENHHNKHVFIASGIVARVLYYESGLYAVRDEEEWRIHSLTIPTAITRCKPANWVAQSIRSRQSAKWEEAERNQTKPVWIDSSTQEGIPTELSTILSLPRCVSVRPSFINANGTLPESEDWLNHYNTAYELYDRPDSHGTREVWYQLKGRPDLPEERRQGSPSSPHFSAVRLELVQNDEVVRSVIVVFVIVSNGDGTFRPWKKGDPVPHLPQFPGPKFSTIKPPAHSPFVARGPPRPSDPRAYMGTVDPLPQHKWIPENPEVVLILSVTDRERSISRMQQTEAIDASHDTKADVSSICSTAEFTRALPIEYLTNRLPSSPTKTLAFPRSNACFVNSSSFGRFATRPWRAHSGFYSLWHMRCT